MRAVSRLTGVAKVTVEKLLRDAGRACADYQNRAFRDLACKRVQVDEIWAFVYAKQANVRKAKAARGSRRRMDMDGNLRRLEADLLLDGRRA